MFRICELKEKLTREESKRLRGKINKSFFEIKKPVESAMIISNAIEYYFLTYDKLCEEHAKREFLVETGIVDRTKEDIAEWLDGCSEKLSYVMYDFAFTLFSLNYDGKEDRSVIDRYHDTIKDYATYFTDFIVELKETIDEVGEAEHGKKEGEL